MQSAAPSSSTPTEEASEAASEGASEPTIEEEEMSGSNKERNDLSAHVPSVSRPPGDQPTGATSTDTSSCWVVEGPIITPRTGVTSA